MSVFPASAGVILNFATSRALALGFPRIRGGDPIAELALGCSRDSFPRIRGGDPYLLRVYNKHIKVFPASAGVILLDARFELDRCSFPRIRGGDPSCCRHGQRLTAFSPHPRG